MSGKGGFKHRLRQARLRQSQRKIKANVNIEKVRGIFAAKGQSWDPENNPQQLAALNHDARRQVQKTDYDRR